MESKPKCEYGANCYRKNPEHLKNYFHPPKRNSQDHGESNQKRPKIEKQKIQTTLNFSRRPPQKQEKPVERRQATTEKQSSPKKFPAEIQHGSRDEQKRSPKKLSPNKKERKTSDEDSLSIENPESDPESQSEICKVSVPVDVKEAEKIIKDLFLLEMPSDFYSFYEFCKSVKDDTPKYAFRKFNLILVGPYDVLSGDLKLDSLDDKEKVLCHWRYFYDPPEFQTVIKGEKGHHIGYWRDDPSELPSLVASNVEKDSTFIPEAENIFGAVSKYLTNFSKTCDPFTKISASKLQSKLDTWAKEKKFTLETDTANMRSRMKKVVSKTFHRLGVVVPVDKKTELGYRPLIETDAKLKKMCKVIMDADDDGEREKCFENLQPLINAANIANDECDFGNSLELGIDLFCMGSAVFHDVVRHLLTTAYSLLNRPEFEEIIRAHLKYRRKGKDLSVFNI